MDFELKKQDEGWAKAFREDCHAEAERSQYFWAAQRAQVRSRIADKRRGLSLRLALVSSVGLFAIAGAMLVGERPIAPSPIAQKPAISDQQLLADIDETLTNPIPDALAPAELISQDMAQSLQAHGQKETR